MANRATTSSVVRLNAKIESVNVFRLAPPADGTLIEEGRFIAFDATAKAGRLGAATDAVLFLNWVDSDRSDVADIQTAPMADLDQANAKIRIETGGLAGIIGGGDMVGLPTSLVTGGTSAVPGDWIKCGANGVVTREAAPATLGGAGAAAPTDRVFGTVVRLEAGIVWFLFNSAAVLYVKAS